MGGDAGRRATRRASSPASRSIRGRWRPASCIVAIRGERFDGADFAARRSRRARRASWCRAAGRRDCRRGRATAAVVIEVDDTTVGAAGAGARASARVGREGRGDYRQRGQDDDEGSDGGVSRGAVPRDPQPREFQQPHRAAAVAHRAEAAAGDRGRRAGHESRRRNQHAGRASPSRTSACGPTSATRTSGSSRRSTRSPTPRPRSSKARAASTLLVANADDDA